jgi:Phage integrase, N-terminal SAM-like domain
MTVPIGRSGFAAGWRERSSWDVRAGTNASLARVLCDTLGMPAVVAGVASFTRKGIAMSKLRNRMIQDMKLAGLCESTQEVYLRAVHQLTAHYMVSPDRITERQVEKYILYLRDELGVATGTFSPMFHGLKFFYIQSLGYDWPLFTKKKSASHAESDCPMFAATRIAAA